MRTFGLDADDARVPGQRSPWAVHVAQHQHPRKGHDRFLCTTDFIGVADGATPLAEGWPDAGEFALSALTSLAETITAIGDRHTDVRDAFARAIGRTMQPGAGPTVSCAVAVAAWHRGNLTLAVLGDCTARALTRDGHVISLHDPTVAHLDAAVQGLDPDDRHAQQLANRRAMNRPETYWIYAGSEEAAQGVLTCTVPARELTWIELYTDGFVRPEELPVRTAADPGVAVPSSVDDSTLMVAQPVS